MVASVQATITVMCIILLFSSFRFVVMQANVAH